MTALPEDARRLARRAGRGAAALAAVAWALIVFGALVRAHGAGLSCPDWPLCHGQVVPEFDARIALEWGHRLLAGTLSLGVVALAVTLLSRAELRPRFMRPLVWICALLALQVTLGGLTVLLGLAPWTVTAHLVVGNTFALSLAWLARNALDLASDVPRAPAPAGRSIWVVAGGVGLQLVLGGLVSSHYAGLACATFPLCNGDSLAPTLFGPVGLHVLHRTNAYLVALAYAVFAWQRPGLAQLGFGLVLVQIAVGAANVLLRLPVEVTALHTGLAAAIFLTTGLLVRDALAARAPTRARLVETPALGGAR
ncbi:MAG TPA: COX15/CtaA family protein [Myxococcota bacterium]|nr:COX15/CtaA family protein [Myxococcota bacterium]